MCVWRWEGVGGSLREHSCQLMLVGWTKMSRDGVLMRGCGEKFMKSVKGHCATCRPTHTHTHPHTYTLRFFFVFFWRSRCSLKQTHTKKPFAWKSWAQFKYPAYRTSTSFLHTLIYTETPTALCHMNLSWSWMSRNKSNQWVMKSKTSWTRCVCGPISSAGKTTRN